MSDVEEDDAAWEAFSGLQIHRSLLHSLSVLCPGTSLW